MDDATKQPYYLALVDVPEENIPRTLSRQGCVWHECRGNHAYQGAHGIELPAGTPAHAISNRLS